MSNTDMNTLIKQGRKFRNISQKELADRMHVSQSFISLIERTDKTLSIQMLERVSRALNLDLKINIQFLDKNTNTVITNPE